MSKVGVVPCFSYDRDAVYEAVKKGINLIGGVEKFAQKNELVLFKPNLLNRADVDKAVTTHPVVFESVARVFIDEGYSKLSYGDSPGHPGSAKRTAEICGIAAEADKLGIPMADFANSRRVEYIQGRIKKHYDICEGVYAAEAIVNISKMKTHQLERVTGAVKNMFGCVYGLNKSKMHAKYPDPESFAQMLVEINHLLKPRLHIMDGIVAMEGNGPGSGDPVAMNVLLFSQDPVALDSVFCHLVDLDPREVPTVYFGDKLDLGKKNPEDIEIVGVKSLEPLINRTFNVERGDKKKNKWTILENLRLISKRPAIIDSKCIRCGACITACPVEGKAIYMNDDEALNAPKYDYGKCIRCYCCQEMCPEGAIIVKWGIGK